MSDNKQVTNPASGSVTAVQEQQRAVLPPVDVFEDASGITLLADMPGVPKEKLELKVEGDALLIEGDVQSHTPDGLEALYAELRVPRYRRSFTLSRELDTTRIEANLKDGVLKLRIPKQAHAQPRRIAVTAG
ncbi:Hsp20/alpha crystallin family protein [Rhodoferax sediminis]|jgi:HSP20 family molecular chaperone IbpA|uniref:Hsp20/alpha crystallin family protein n=1 Tax=Rhodoferax sediminis TaxID=2509614 RepID=A0A515DBR1_9BURK|nr:Hsp20/alpha crystallin family protein [Rhodoferax sediminis]QDL37847.1 Hsp20/alpha crystallin family protein [Rhodoferax sediminis]